MQTSHRLKGDGHNISAPGFSQTADPFAILDRRGQIDDDDDGYEPFQIDGHMYLL